MTVQELLYSVVNDRVSTPETNSAFALADLSLLRSHCEQALSIIGDLEQLSLVGNRERSGASGLAKREELAEILKSLLPEEISDSLGRMRWVPDSVES